MVDAGGRYLGQGFYNPRPSLCCRLLTRRDEAIDASFFRRRLEAAWEYRRTAGLVSDAYRLCWSEADGLPGLVVDRYGPVSVVQCLTLGMFKAAGWITAALTRLFPDGSIHRLDEPTAARLEGFDARQDPAGQELVVTEGDVPLRRHPWRGPQDRPLPRPGREPRPRSPARRRAPRARRLLLLGRLRLPRAAVGRDPGAPARLVGRRARAGAPESGAERRDRPGRSSGRAMPSTSCGVSRRQAGASAWSSSIPRPSRAGRTRSRRRRGATRRSTSAGSGCSSPAGCWRPSPARTTSRRGSSRRSAATAAGDAGVNVRVLRTLAQSRDHPCSSPSPNRAT